MPISHIKNTVLRRVVLVAVLPVAVPVCLVLAIIKAGYEELTEVWPVICLVWDGERRYR